jgi:hypothetical protein
MPWSLPDRIAERLAPNHLTVCDREYVTGSLTPVSGPAERPPLAGSAEPLWMWSGIAQPRAAERHG